MSRRSCLAAGLAPPAPASWPVRWRLARGLRGADPGRSSSLFGGVIGQIATAADPRRLQQRGAERGADPRRRVPDRLPRRSANSEARQGPQLERLRPARRRLGAGLRRRTAYLLDAERTTRRPSGRRSPGSPTTAACGSRPSRSLDDNRRPSTGYVQYARSLEHVDDDDRPGLAADRRPGSSAAPCWRSRRGRDRRPGDAADRLADRDRARDRRPPATPRSGCPSPTTTTRSASWRGRWRRCSARSTRPAPNARARCRSSASSSPTPRTSCARR